MVHSSSCSDLDLSLIRLTSLVVSLGLASLAASARSVIASNSVSLMDPQLQQVRHVSSTSVLDAMVDASMVGNGTVMGSSSFSIFPHLILEASIGSVFTSSSVNVQKSSVGK